MTQFDKNGERIPTPAWPGPEGAPAPIDPHDLDHMVKISKLIADLQAIHSQFGDTCVYVRRHGLSWGGVALTYRSEDEKHGVFDLQADHDREMEGRIGQTRRLIEDRDRWRDRAWALEKEKPS